MGVTGAHDAARVEGRKRSTPNVGNAVAGCGGRSDKKGGQEKAKRGNVRVCACTVLHCIATWYRKWFGLLDSFIHGCVCVCVFSIPLSEQKLPVNLS